MARLTQQEAILVHFGILAHAFQILMAKRKDYSGEDDPFRNFRGAHQLGLNPILGALVREGDKSSRLASLVHSGQLGTGGRVGESVIDTLADKLNYTGIMAGLVAEMDEAIKLELIGLGDNLVTIICDLADGAGIELPE